MPLSSSSTPLPTTCPLIIKQPTNTFLHSPSFFYLFSSKICLRILRLQPPRFPASPVSQQLQPHVPMINGPPQLPKPTPQSFHSGSLIMRLSYRGNTSAPAARDSLHRGVTQQYSTARLHRVSLLPSVYGTYLFLTPWASSPQCLCLITLTLVPFPKLTSAYGQSFPDADSKT